MGVYIPCMDMPVTCRYCPFEDPALDYVCKLTYRACNWGMKERPSYCPLVQIPDNLRLIDANTAYDKIAEEAAEGSGNYVDMDIVGRGLDYTPTIIPASKEGET